MLNCLCTPADHFRAALADRVRGVVRHRVLGGRAAGVSWGLLHILASQHDADAPHVACTFMALMYTYTSSNDVHTHKLHIVAEAEYIVSDLLTRRS